MNRFQQIELEITSNVPFGIIFVQEKAKYTSCMRFKRTTHFNHCGFQPSNPDFWLVFQRVKVTDFDRRRRLDGFKDVSAFKVFGEDSSNLCLSWSRSY